MKRIASWPQYPTIPDVIGGIPSMGSVCNSFSTDFKASKGLPPVWTPSGVVPSHAASPSRTVNADLAPVPINDHRDQERPGSADSKRNVPGLSWAKALYALSGVSPSAKILRATGTTLW